ncbi:3-methyl-2-oxobutanoate hydroxymethyltransferase [Azospirillum palustre]|uniref:3-methyl-2-oxobutanoate hydroxymethyltransferase n=1 Tax=Azospirillum palustre TaxID=2044885 RepID=A0A2B8AWV5_9PROT|nr:3-methyl-2-oxobutanoate hydroxymethyltransferase [Azospirillum palustre]PGH53434.1 3-methyl-2-oxobutanoate hydroxymethyltransferase [Azospirillum palustre]
MSASNLTARHSVPALRARKGGEPIVCLTAYTAPVARLLDPHVDILLVGDSLGMVVYGLDSTLPVTLDTMIAHGAAVVRASERACVVVDLPFGSYQESKEAAFRASARVMAETGAQAIKLEGGIEMAETVAFLTARGIPVMGHVGLTPQSVNTLGGYKAVGRDAEAAERIVADARAISEAGAFTLVIEGTMEALARRITEEVAIPTIGIGGSPACDGQVLVTDDMLGLFGAFQPKFVKRYANLGETVSEAAATYAAEVRTRAFPGPEHCFGMKKAAAV